MSLVDDFGSPADVIDAFARWRGTGFVMGMARVQTDACGRPLSTFHGVGMRPPKLTAAMAVASAMPRGVVAWVRPSLTGFVPGRRHEAAPRSVAHVHRHASGAGRTSCGGQRRRAGLSPARRCRDRRGPRGDEDGLPVRDVGWAVVAGQYGGLE